MHAPLCVRTVAIAQIHTVWLNPRPIFPAACAKHPHHSKHILTSRNDFSQCAHCGSRLCGQVYCRGFGPDLSLKHIQNQEQSVEWRKLYARKVPKGTCHNNLPCIMCYENPKLGQFCCGPGVWNPLNINKYGGFLSGKHPAFLQVDTPDPDDSAELRRELVLAPLHELDWNWLMSMTGRFCNFTLDTLDIHDGSRWIY